MVTSRKLQKLERQCGTVNMMNARKGVNNNQKHKPMQVTHKRPTAQKGALCHQPTSTKGAPCKLLNA